MAVGASIGLALLALLYALVWLFSREAAAFAWQTVREGVLLPIVYLILVLGGFALLTSVQFPVDRFVESLRRVMSVGAMERMVQVPARSVDHIQPLQYELRPDELQNLRIESDQDVVLAAEKRAASGGGGLEVQAGEPLEWTAGSERMSPIPNRVTQLYITNASDAPANIRISWKTDVEYPEVYSVAVTAAAVLGLFAAYFLPALLFPKVSAIAVATAKEAVSQPIFLLILGLGAFALVVFIYVPYNTFGEDVKMLKSSGLTLIMVLAVVFGLWTASVAVADEIDGRTALTVLSKPVGRREFVLGKFLGIIWPVILVFVLLGSLFLATVSRKVVYDARESASAEPNWQECYQETVSTVPGLVLSLLETIVLVSISVAVSTRLPMLPNLIICSTIYVLGHLGPMIVNSAAGQFEIVGFVGRLIATVLPLLENFNIEPAIAGGVPVPAVYLLWAVVYCVLYSSMAMLVALFLFEDRDLA
jgi:hypothetical protein